MSICGSCFILLLLLLFSAVLRRTVTLDCGIPVVPMIKNFPTGSKIVGGWEVNPNSVPWQVLVAAERVNSEYLCGGTLISLDTENESSLVLTAAHCVFDHSTLKTIEVEKILIIVGAHDIEKKEPRQIMYRVRNMAIHYLYKNSSVLHDIALLKLRAPVPHNRYSLPVCIPKFTDILPIGNRCWTTGWGRDYNNKSSPRLKMVPSPILHPKKCGIRRAESSFCICGGMLNRMHVPSKGDSGGPLFCEVNGVMVQHGIVSFKGRRSNKLCGYVKVLQYYPWIVRSAASFNSLSIIERGINFISSVWNMFTGS